MFVCYVKANNADGYFEAEDERGARDAFARDAGYESEADMIDCLEEPSEIVVLSMLDMTNAELDEHANRLRKLAAADFQHADELRRYVEKRGRPD